MENLVIFLFVEFHSPLVVRIPQCGHADVDWQLHFRDCVSKVVQDAIPPLLIIFEDGCMHVVFTMDD